MSAAGFGSLLIVDDSTSDIYTARRCAELAGIEAEVIGLESGQALIDYVEDVLRGERPMPSHVLLDINLPGIDGFEALETVRRMTQFATTPSIIVFTNSVNPRDREKAEGLGADGFVRKPSSIRDFVEFFRSLLAVET